MPDNKTKNLPGFDEAPVGDFKKYQVGHRQRMKDRFMTAGPDSFADYELLESYLYSLNPRQDTRPLAKDLLEGFDSLAGVFAAESGALEKIPGLGPNAIFQFKIVQALAVRMARQEVMNKPVLSSWDALLDYVRLDMAYKKREEFRILFLNSKNVLVADEVQSIGTIDHTAVYVREVVHRALDLKASAIILVHNHPSGDPKPSKGDIDMTNDIIKACKHVAVKVHDHIVVGKHGHVSFKSRGII